MNKLDKLLLKRSYYVVSLLFMMGLVLVAFIKENIENNEVRIILDYYFWFSLGLLLGFTLARYLFKKYYNSIFSRKNNE